MQALERNQETSKVIVKRVIAAERERVFDAWTKPELMNKWYVGGKGFAKCSVDLRVGGKYSNEMIVEEKSCQADGEPVNNSNSKSYMHTGEYLEIKRPERLVFTWNSPAVQNTRVIVELRAVEEGTEVTITHELLDLSQVEGHTKGWNYALDNLSSTI